MTCLGCLTHPALCRPGECPDYDGGEKGKRYILKMHSSMHGAEYKVYTDTSFPGGVRRNRSPQRETELAGVRAHATQKNRSEKEVKKNCLPSASTLDKQRFGAK